MDSTPILFLDLDDTVRLGPKALKGKFVNKAADVDLFDGVLDIIKSYKARGWRIVAISNQGGIALGLADEREVGKAMQETNRLCAGLFDRIMWCPHHPDAPKTEDAICLCRKPRIGNVVTAMISMSQQFQEYYTPHNCLFVGDLGTDEECARNANIPFKQSEQWRKDGPLSD